MNLMTIGHSTRKIEEFVGVLINNGVVTVYDVRSTPLSRFCPHFNKERLNVSLRGEGIRYFHLPNLGGRPKGGMLSYRKLIETNEFKRGIDMILSGGEGGCLMCSEKDPLSCHRFVVLSRFLRINLNLTHITSNRVESQKETETRMVEMYLRGVNGDLFNKEGKIDVERCFELRHLDIYRI